MTRRLLVLRGVSGSGKSTATRALLDDRYGTPERIDDPRQPRRLGDVPRVGYRGGPRRDPTGPWDVVQLGGPRNHHGETTGIDGMHCTADDIACYLGTVGAGPAETAVVVAEGGPLLDDTLIYRSCSEWQTHVIALELADDAVAHERLRARSAAIGIDYDATSNRMRALIGFTADEYRARQARQLHRFISWCRHASAAPRHRLRADVLAVESDWSPAEVARRVVELTGWEDTLGAIRGPMGAPDHDDGPVVTSTIANPRNTERTSTMEHRHS